MGTNSWKFVFLNVQICFSQGTRIISRHKSLSMEITLNTLMHKQWLTFCRQHWTFSDTISQKEILVSHINFHSTLFPSVYLTESALVWVMAWHQTCNKSLPESMMNQFTDAYMRCVTRPQWVKDRVHKNSIGFTFTAAFTMLKKLCYSKIKFTKGQCFGKRSTRPHE